MLQVAWATYADDCFAAPYRTVCRNRLFSGGPVWSSRFDVLYLTPRAVQFNTEHPS